MALNTNDFEVIGDAPKTQTPDQFEVIGDAKPSPAFDTSKLGTDPYEKYRLALYNQNRITLPGEGFQIPTPTNKSTPPGIGFEAAAKEFPGPDASHKYSDEGLISSLPKAAVSDIAAGFSGGLRKLGFTSFPAGSEVTGNVPAAFMGDELPTEKIISDISSDPENRTASVLAKVSLGVAKTAPLLAIGGAGLPAAAQKLVAAAFVVDMARHVPGTFRALGEEMGKPESERDNDKISSLISEGAQELGFTALGAHAGIKGGAEMLSKQLVDRYVPKGQGVGEPIVQSPRLPNSPIQGPYALGRFMQMPKGAEPELRVENFEPLDTQSGTPLSPQELLARQSRSPVTPDTGEAPVKFFNLDEPEGGPNAVETRQEPKGDITEHPGDASERPPAQPGGGGGVEQRTETPQGNEPVTPTGDARGEPNQETPPVTDHIKSVSEMSPDQFTEATGKWEGGLTRQAWRVGQSAQSLDDVNALKSAQESSSAIAKDKTKSMSERMSAANKAQFFREAHEAATGTGSAGKALSERDPNYQPPFPDGKEPEMVGMGGARYGEVGGESETEGRETYGVRHSNRVARARAGEVEPVERGEGISWQESVGNGRNLIALGADPESVMQNFEKTKQISADSMAIARAHGEALAQQARNVEEKFGTESKQFEDAYKNYSDWDKRSKAMQTEWHKAGQAQQGITDIDTGSFTGMKHEYEETTGKEITPEKTKQAKKLAKDVSDQADKVSDAKDALKDQVARETGDAKTVTEAERRALDAANKTVRDAASRMAQAKSKLRVAKSADERAAAEAEWAKEKKAFDAATQKARVAATRLADAENKSRIEEASRQKPDDQEKAAQRALDAAMEVRKQAAKDLADAENKARSAKSQRDKETANIEVNRTKKALDAAQKRAREAAIKSAKEEQKRNAMSLPEKVWKAADKYLDKGITDFDHIRNAIATDMGLPVDKVTEAMAKSKTSKYLLDDLWKKQQEYRRLDQKAKRWLADQNKTIPQKALEAVPNLMFGAKVFGHGTVALGTHAPMVAFQPRYWKSYAQNFANMYHMVLSRPFYERMTQDLLRRPNYVTARRAGLVNDPKQFEDYNSPEVTKWLGPLARTGDRGYSVLKHLRQDMFDQQWDKLPQTLKTPDMAKAISDGVNHATGVVQAKAPKGSSTALFAPRLFASRAAWLAGDPLKALGTAFDWKNATDAQKHFAINQIKEKAWVVGTMLSMLAANEGVLEASKSKQRVNITDPMKKDWMKFKVGGLDIGYGNAMLSAMRLPLRLNQIRESDGGKLKNLVYPDESTWSTLGEYGRSQASPFASLMMDLWFKSDWQNRPLPNSNRPVPKRLAAQGVKPYTWPEFWTEKALNIPAEEAAREVWKNGMGMSPQQVEQAKKAFTTILIMAGTGARVEDDTEAQNQ